MTSNEHPGIHRRRAGIWRVVAGVAFLLICAVTLTPSTGPPSRGFSICIRCGDSNGLDVFYNVVLFVPLGFALWRAGVNRRSAIAFAAALSIVIEVLQLAFIAGRYSSLRDILANSLGAVVGVVLAEHAETLRDPAPAMARVLVIGGALTLIVFNGVTAWLLRPSLPSGPWWAQFAPRQRLYPDHFRGMIRNVRFATANLEAGNQVDGATVSVVRAEPEIACQLVADVVAGPVTAGVAPIAAVADEHNHVVALLAQVGRGAMFRVRMRAADAGLSSPAVRVSSAVPPAGGHATVTGRLRDGRLSVEVRTPNGAVERDLQLSPSWTWALLVPEGFYPSTVMTKTATTVWLAALASLLGFWCSHAGTRRESRILQGVAFVAMVGALLVVPWVFRLPVSEWSEWFGFIAGFVCGTQLATPNARKGRRSAT